MPSINKKIFIITSVIVIVIIIIVADIFLYLNYRGQQEQKQEEAKIQNDIAYVQEQIAQENYEEIQPETLISQDFAAEAVEMAKEAIRIEELRIEQEQENTFENQVISLVNELTDYTSQLSSEEIRQRLINLSPEIISDLENLTRLQDQTLRYNGYSALSIIADESEENRKEIVPILRKALSDPNLDIKLQMASALLYHKEKEGLGFLIPFLDNQYKEVMTTVSEPPDTVQNFAMLTLSDYTGLKYGYDMEKWQQWWDNKNEKIKYDEDLGDYK